MFFLPYARKRREEDEKKNLKEEGAKISRIIPQTECETGKWLR